MQGFIATATLRYRATFANMLGSAPGIVTYNYRVRIADGVAQATVSRDVEAATSLGPGFGSVSHSFSGAIGRPGQSNFGQFLWSFSNGTLTLLATPQTGGFRFTVRFMQGDRSIICTPPRRISATTAPPPISRSSHSAARSSSPTCSRSNRAAQ